ncbi:MAG TPA: hypothetical protein PK559_14390, partial [Ignavibacteriaceae bacterium]|nr:hypothetical protein [Ignavibacteriaceae bacterium]
RERSHMRNMEKILQLEKVKLMEVLNLDEETSVKFFIRLKDHREKMRENMEQLDKLTDELRKKLEDENLDVNDSQFKKFNDEMVNIENNGKKIRVDFIKSVSEILTPIQISKFLVFERAFRNEMQDLLMKKRGGGRGKK